MKQKSKFYSNDMQKGETVFFSSNESHSESITFSIHKFTKQKCSEHIYFGMSLVWISRIIVGNDMQEMCKIRLDHYYIKHHNNITTLTMSAEFRILLFGRRRKRRTCAV